jgi:hypothetical protein
MQTETPASTSTIKKRREVRGVFERNPGEWWIRGYWAYSA